MYFYERFSKGLYVSRNKLTYHELKNDESGYLDKFLGYAKTEREARKVIKKAFFSYSEDCINSLLKRIKFIL